MHEQEREVLRGLAQKLQPCNKSEADDESGDEVAFENFYNEMSQRWISYFTSKREVYGLAREEVEDVVQAVMLVIIQKHPNFDTKGEAAFSTWCYAIARRIALRYKIQKLRIIQLDEETDKAETLYAKPSDEDFVHLTDISSEEELNIWLRRNGKIQRALRSLNKVEQYIILQKVIWGLTHKEIAAKLNRNNVDVRVQFYRARQKLKLLLLKGKPRKTHGQR